MPQPWRELRHHLFSLKFRQLSSCMESPASEPSGLLGAVTKAFRETGRSGTPGDAFSCRACVGLDGSAGKAQTVINFPSGFTGADPFDSKSMWIDMLTTRYLFLALIALGCLLPASAQVINCPSGFASSGSCGVSLIGSSGQPFALVGSPNGSNPALAGSQVELIPTGATHTAVGFIYQAKVNVQAFTSTFTFVPNGQNLAFVVENNTNSNAAGTGPNFSSGAGCEAGFYQAFDANDTPPNNIFALELDSYSPLTESGSFTYSSAQIYQAGQSPCLPNDDGPNYYPTNKISTSPVNLTAGSPGTSTGDVYSATVTYDGTNFTLKMYNVTAGGSCPGASCFTQVWPVNIPSLVGGPTAYVGFTAGVNVPNLPALYANSFTFTEGSTGQAPTPTQAGTPMFSPAAGTYSDAQSVTLATASSGAVICYNTTGSPATNGSTGCATGTRYTGPVTVSSSQTLYAVAGGTGFNDSSVVSASYVIQSSVSTPTFSPAAGAYTSAQSVTISNATSGATIYYTTNGTTPTTSSTEYTSPITVGSTETLEAIAVATGDNDSAVASAAYTVASSLPSVSTPTFSPAAGAYTSAQSVTISDATSGATIYYTTNGTTPTTSSTKYTGPITVSSTETLEAIAVATGDSAVASATYTINSQPNFVLGTSTASLTVNSGGQGTLTLTVTPENGFDSPVILVCSALPTWATCSFDQATVTPSGGAVSTQLTISTSAQSSALQPGSRPFFPFTALAMTVCLFGWRKRRGWHHCLLLAIAYAGLGLLFGCGGTSGGGGTSATPTPTSTTSTVTITAIAGPLEGTAAIALTVN
jgi:hypothetical protein